MPITCPEDEGRTQMPMISFDTTHAQVTFWDDLLFPSLWQNLSEVKAQSDPLLTCCDKNSFQEAGAGSGPGHLLPVTASLLGSAPLPFLPLQALLPTRWQPGVFSHREGRILALCASTRPPLSPPEASCPPLPLASLLLHCFHVRHPQPCSCPEHRPFLQPEMLFPLFFPCLLPCS